MEERPTNRGPIWWYGRIGRALPLLQAVTVCAFFWGCADEEAPLDPSTQWSGTYTGWAVTSTAISGNTVVAIDSILTSLNIAPGPDEYELVVLGDVVNMRPDGGYQGPHDSASYESFTMAFFPTDSLRISYFSQSTGTSKAYFFRGKKD